MSGWLPVRVHISQKGATCRDLCYLRPDKAVGVPGLKRPQTFVYMHVCMVLALQTAIQLNGTEMWALGKEMFVVPWFDANIQVGHRLSLLLARRSIVRKKKKKEDKGFQNSCKLRCCIFNEAKVLLWWIYIIHQGSAGCQPKHLSVPQRWRL